jgi:hypothetical protein
LKNLFRFVEVFLEWDEGKETGKDEYINIRKGNKVRRKEEGLIEGW